MLEPSHDPTGYAPPASDACLAEIVERAWAGDPVALASLLKQARPGEGMASDFFLARLQQGHSATLDFLLKQAQLGLDEAFDFFLEGQRRGYPATFAFLVEHAQRGDATAFSLLYRHYERPVGRYLAYAVGNKTAAEDLTQETFFSAWKDLPNTDAELRLKFRSWIYTIATNKSKDYFREYYHEEPLQSLEKLEEDIGGSKPHVEGPENIACTIDCIEQALARVPPRSRACLEKQYQGYSLKEIADELGIDPKCASAYISRGRKRFRQAFQQFSNEQTL